jgi:hypothetical protein
MPLVIDGTTSGSTTIQSANSVTATITLPATSGMFPRQDSATGALYLPVGTTAQRPTASLGMLRYNTTLGVLEYYNGTNWYKVTSTII